jgi:RNA polymerase sigma-70 factor (ECF subfamily)
MPERASPVERLAREQRPRLYRVGLGFCGNHADAEDLVQETLLRAVRAWDRFEGRADPATWLYRIASRVCMRMRRRRAGQPASIESIDADPSFSERSMVDLDALAREQESGAAADALRAGIVALPAAFRLPLVLKEIAGLSIEATADVLGLKPQTVKTRLHRARLRLRRAVARELPARAGAPPAYDRQVCMDLLRAKQGALDRGVPFEPPGGVVCERCRSVFGALDLVRDLCGRIGEGTERS